MIIGLRTILVEELLLQTLNLTPATDKNQSDHVRGSEEAPGVGAIQDPITIHALDQGLGLRIEIVADLPHQPPATPIDDDVIVIHGRYPGLQGEPGLPRLSIPEKAHLSPNPHVVLIDILVLIALILIHGPRGLPQNPNVDLRLVLPAIPALAQGLLEGAIEEEVGLSLAPSLLDRRSEVDRL